jgi:L-asparaginase/Glu-tRNA(Gln) amidotransferase subunit D
MTGAMTPSGFGGSDGLQNLTESLIAAQLSELGIFLVMHGQFFEIDRVQKDKALGRFVPAPPRPCPRRDCT